MNIKQKTHLKNRLEASIEKHRDLNKGDGKFEVIEGESDLILAYITKDNGNDDRPEPFYFYGGKNILQDAGCENCYETRLSPLERSGGAYFAEYITVNQKQEQSCLN